MKNIKYIFFAACVALFAYSCTSMDDNYKDFIKEGPIVYLTSLQPTDITIIGERNSAQIVLPKLYDLRAKKVVVYWANKTQKTEQSINTGGETSFTITNLTEGTYIFEFVFVDEDGNKSLATPVTAEIYGGVYESYLMNRPVKSYTTDPATGKPTKLVFAISQESTMVKTIVEWSENGTEKSIEVDTLIETVELQNFNAHSLRYRTIYCPGKTDLFYSPYSYLIVAPTAGQIAYDRRLRQFDFPDFSDDDHWVGYEMKWTDRLTFESKSSKFIDRSFSYTIPDYESPEFSYTALFNYDTIQISSNPTTKPTSTRAFLDRSNWIVPLETETATGRELKNVMDGTWTAAAAAISAKTKSPYLSQKLPWSNATANDGLNSPRAHIDGDNATYLSMVKGPGISFEDVGGAAHTNGGVASNDANFGNEVYFIIDLGKEEEFDYFHILYRINGTGAATLRPMGLILFGSNDPDCITDQSKWTAITDRIVPPNCTLANSGNLPDTPQNSTGNISIKSSKYHYIKCRYTDWATTSNTIQITEFNLGGTIY